MNLINPIRRRGFFCFQIYNTYTTIVVYVLNNNFDFFPINGRPSIYWWIARLHKFLKFNKIRLIKDKRRSRGFFVFKIKTPYQKCGGGKIRRAGHRKLRRLTLRG